MTKKLHMKNVSCQNNKICFCSAPVCVTPYTTIVTIPICIVNRIIKSYMWKQRNKDTTIANTKTKIHCTKSIYS